MFSRPTTKSSLARPFLPPKLNVSSCFLHKRFHIFSSSRSFSTSIRYNFLFVQANLNTSAPFGKKEMTCNNASVGRISSIPELFFKRLPTFPRVIILVFFFSSSSLSSYSSSSFVLPLLLMLFSRVVIILILIIITTTKLVVVDETERKKSDFSRTNNERICTEKGKGRVDNKFFSKSRSKKAKRVEQQKQQKQ